MAILKSSRTTCVILFFICSIVGSYGQPTNNTITSWSNDGSKILITSNRDSTSEIYEVNLNDSVTKQITTLSNGAVNWWGVYSPNESKIAFYSWRDGNAEIYVMDSDGANQNRLTFNDTYDYYPTWSPNGKQIAF